MAALVALLAVSACAPVSVSAPPAGPGPHVTSGIVQWVSPDARRVTLLDGRTLDIPAPRPFIQDELRPGAFVVAEYVRQDGRNVVSRLTIHPPEFDPRD